MALSSRFLIAGIAMNALAAAANECSAGRGFERDGSQEAQDAARARAEAKRARKAALRSTARPVR